MYKCIYQYHKINWQRSNVQFKFFLLSREVKSCLNWKKRKKEKKKKKEKEKKKKTFIEKVQGRTNVEIEKGEFTWPHTKTRK